MSETGHPTSWKLHTLKDVARWGSGGTPKGRNPAYYGGPIPWAIIGDLNDGIMSGTAGSITKEGLANSSAKVVPEGSVLIAMYGSIGKLGINASPMATNQAIAFAIPDGEKILRNYLFYYLMRERPKFIREGKGATQQNISQTILRPWPIPVPPLAEQKRIVEILEEQFSRLDAGLASIRTVREKAKAFRRSLLQAAFRGDLSVNGTVGWEELRIKEILVPMPNGKLVGQGWSPQCEVGPSGDDEWGVLKTTAIQAGRFEPEHNKRLPASLQPRPDIEVKPGDLLITCAGPRKRCGVPCLVRATRGKLMLSGKMYRFRPDTKQIELSYLEYFLLSPRAQYDIDDMKTGISDSGLNLTHGRFFTLMVPVAPLAEQRRLVGMIEEQLSRVDNALAIADELEARFASERRSILHATFAGTLTAQWRETHNG